MCVIHPGGISAVASGEFSHSVRLHRGKFTERYNEIRLIFEFHIEGPWNFADLPSFGETISRGTKNGPQREDTRETFSTACT